MKIGEWDVKSDADICRENGWVIGTVIEGTESGEGWSYTTRIVITAVGERDILAREVKRGGYESNWTLQYRDWKKVR